MKKIVPILLAISALAMLPSCVTTKAIARNKSTSEQWLASQHKAQPRINVTGTYTSVVYHWGGAQLAQNGSQVTGTIGSYTLHGVVRGTHVYLLAVNGGLNKYSMILNAKGDNLQGAFSDSIPFSIQDAEQITLEKISL
ncbi:MAG: hypothetical protein ABI443_07775 [Chthoniobacterales bacterium]